MRRLKEIRTKPSHKYVPDAVFKDENGQICIVEFKNFSHNIRKIRQDRAFTLREVEKLSGVSNAYLAQLESGKRGIPNIEILGKLSKVYDVPLIHLIAPKSKATVNKPTKHDLSSDGYFIGKAFDNFSPSVKLQLKTYLRYLLQEEKKTKKKA